MLRRFVSVIASLCVAAVLFGCGVNAPTATEPRPPQEQLPATETVPDAETVPLPTLAPEYPAQSEPEPVPEPVPAPEPEPEPTMEPDTEPESVPEQESVPEPEPEPEPETAPKILTTLMYHDFMPDGVPPTDWVITAEMFRSDLQWLKDNGYTTVLPRELAAGKLDSGEPIPDKIVMITFDDGYPSNYTIAMPLLQEYSMKAAVALIVNNFEIDSPEFLTWDQCRKMQESGCFEFGSHTYDLHIREGINGIERLDGESQDDYTLRIREDIAKSVEIIEAELGAPVTYFAYPLGKVDPWANDVLAEFFSVSVTSERAKADLSNGLYRLPRYNVTANERAAGFIE